MFSQEEQPFKNYCLMFSVGKLHPYCIIDFLKCTGPHSPLLILQKFNDFSLPFKAILITRLMSTG